MRTVEKVGNINTTYRNPHQDCKQTVCGATYNSRMRLNEDFSSILDTKQNSQHYAFDYQQCQHKKLSNELVSNLLHNSSSIYLVLKLK